MGLTVMGQTNFSSLIYKYINLFINPLEKKRKRNFFFQDKLLFLRNCDVKNPTHSEQIIQKLLLGQQIFKSYSFVPYLPQRVYTEVIP